MSYLFIQKGMLSTVNKCSFQERFAVANLLAFAIFQAISDEVYGTNVIAFQQSCKTWIGELETHRAVFGVFPDIAVERI